MGISKNPLSLRERIPIPIATWRSKLFSIITRQGMKPVGCTPVWNKGLLMRDNDHMIIPTEIDRLCEFYIAFRLSSWFITDNKIVIMAPHNRFCAQCFKRRYFSEFNAERIKEVSEDALMLARSIDRSSKPGSDWSCFSIESQKFLKQFDLISYENCPRCGKNTITTRSDAEKKYKHLIHEKSTPNIGGLNKLLFSFGFARSAYSSNKLNFGDERFEKILGGSFFSRISARISPIGGNLTDINTLGYATNKELAELKSTMEFIERYAFIEQTIPLVSNEYDKELIQEQLSLYSRAISPDEMSEIKGSSVWAMDLTNYTVSPVPTQFIYDKGKLKFIRPCSSGFAAHVDFQKSLISGILELVERDAFIRFWHDPMRAYDFQPGNKVLNAVNDIIDALDLVLNNGNLFGRCYAVKSPTGIPVVMTTISSKDYNKPPSLIFGYGVGFSLHQALLKSLDELRTNALNFLVGVSSDKDFLRKNHDYRNIKSIPDRMNFYSTHHPRSRLAFLEMENPVIDGAYKNLDKENLGTVVKQFSDNHLKIYGIDMTPACFKDKNVYVTRAFSPNLFPLQYEEENSFDLNTSELSLKDELPHFFI